MDYTPISVTLVFNSNINQTCADIPLDEDLIVENVESFGAQLSSQDPEVVIFVSEIDVFIADTTRKIQLYICNNIYIYSSACMTMAHGCVFHHRV